MAAAAPGGADAALAQAGPSVQSARLDARVAAEGHAEVRITYALTPGTGDSLSVEVLGFPPAAVADLRVGSARGDGDVPVVLAAASGTRSTGRLGRPPAPGDAPDTVVLHYRVEAAVETDGAGVRVRLPVVGVDAPAAATGPRVFEAAVTLPEGWSVAGGFPTGLTPAGPGVWTVQLAVVPALVSLRGRSDGAWRPGFGELLDVLAAAVLLAFGLFGWRHLRRVARGEA